MFQHIPGDVQQKILALIATAHTAGGDLVQLLDHARLILLLVRRFPATLRTHAARLLETLCQGLAAAPNAAAAQPFREILLTDVQPLLLGLLQSTAAAAADGLPDVPAPIVNRVLACAFEYHVQQMFRGVATTAAASAAVAAASTDSAAAVPVGADAESALDNEHWRRLLDTLAICGRMLQWEPFPRFERGASKDLYWKAVCQIVAAAPPRPSENKQILFCATILFVMALQAYMKDVRPTIAQKIGYWARRLARLNRAIELIACIPSQPDAARQRRCGGR